MSYNVAAICRDFLGQCELIIAINTFNSNSRDLLFHIISHYLLFFIRLFSGAPCYMCARNGFLMAVLWWERLIIWKKHKDIFQGKACISKNNVFFSLNTSIYLFKEYSSSWRIWSKVGSESLARIFILSSSWLF